jgi:hypothetical protein
MLLPDSIVYDTDSTGIAQIATYCDGSLLTSAGALQTGTAQPVHVLAKAWIDRGITTMSTDCLAAGIQQSSQRYWWGLTTAASKIMSTVLATFPSL